MYKLTIHLNIFDPLPQVGDMFEIVALEDGEYASQRPYVIATLEPIKKPFFQEDDVAPV